MWDLFHGFAVVKPWESGSLERSSTLLVALPSTLELTFLNWVTLRCVDAGNVLTFFFPFKLGQSFC